jgi:hypothetical protein
MPKINRRQLLTSAAAMACIPTIWPFGTGSLLAEDAADTKTSKSAPTKKKSDPYKDAKFVEGAPPLPGKDNFTVVVLPDTQHYSLEHPQNFHAQTEWIVANVKDRRIAAALHLGDITHRSTLSEWEVAQAAMNRLDGIVPYFMVPGNHDYSDGKSLCVDRTTHFNDYFPLKKFQDAPTFGGTYDKEPERFENSFHTFSAGGRRFLVVGLEYGPRQDVVRWANEVVAKHQDHEAILITHAYMYSDDNRYNWKKFGAKQSWNPHASGIAKSSQDDVQDGEDLWNNLVSKHDNFFLTLNGHVLHDGLGHLISKNVGNKNVHQVLVNFQMKPKGGDGWLRLLEFSSDSKSIDVIDYSPTRNQCNVSVQNRFRMQIA